MKASILRWLGRAVGAPIAGPMRCQSQPASTPVSESPADLPALNSTLERYQQAGEAAQVQSTAPFQGLTRRVQPEVRHSAQQLFYRSLADLAPVFRPHAKHLGDDVDGHQIGKVITIINYSPGPDAQQMKRETLPSPRCCSLTRHSVYSIQ